MMNRNHLIFLVAIIVAAVATTLVLLLGKSGSRGLVNPDAASLQVKLVGGMALDVENSNVYLTASATIRKEPTANNTRCLLRMLSYSAEEGFASMDDNVFPKSSVDPFVNGDYACPGDPRCMVRRQLEEFQQVDESIYPEICSRIYIEDDEIVILGRLSPEPSSASGGRGSVMVMRLDANKIRGDETQEIRLEEEPLVAAFDGKGSMYLVSLSSSYSKQIVLYRYSRSSNGSWQLDWTTNRGLISPADSGRIHITSLDVVLGDYLAISGTIENTLNRSVGRLGFYHALDGSVMQDFYDGTNQLLLQDADAQAQAIECVCLDKQQSDASVAILYRVTSSIIEDKTISVVHKLRLEKERTSASDFRVSLVQSSIWTQGITHASIKKCHVANDSLVLAGFALLENDSSSKQSVLSISKRSTRNGDLLWTAKQASLSDNASHVVRLADIVTDSQGNVLVYGQVNGDGDDVVLLQALDGIGGTIFAHTNSPEMTTTRSRRSVAAGRSHPQPRAIDIVSREQLLSSYEVPLTIIIVGLVVMLILSICTGCMHRANEKEKERESFDRRIMSVFSYLRPFDAKQVDIHQSPTGGFNATYTEDLLEKSSHDPIYKGSNGEVQSRPLSARL